VTEQPGAAGAQVQLRRNALLLVVADVLVGVGNYAFSLVLVWTLAPGIFADVASVTSLLLVVGTAASAAIPWVVAREVSATTRHSPGRSEILSFSIAVSTGLSLVTALIVAIVAIRFASPGMVVLACAHTVFVFTTDIGAGYLQGEHRFAALAGVRLTEVGTRFVVGVSLAIAFGTGTAAIGGLATGSAVSMVVAAALMRHDLRGLRRVRSQPRFWRQAAGIGAIQGGVALLCSLDVLTFVVRQGDASHLGGYQAVLVFARIPLFIGTALSVVAYPRMATEQDPTKLVTTVRETLGIYLLLASVVGAVVATIPQRLIDFILPAQYSVTTRLLLPLAIAGVGIGLVNLVTTYFQARSAFRPVLRYLAVGTVVATVALAFASSGDVLLLAWMSAAVNSALAVTVLAMTAVLLHAWSAVRRTLPWLALGALLVVLLGFADRSLLLWIVLVAALGAACLVVFARSTRHHEPPVRGADWPGKVLHLGFEDPARPGSGGGAVRTHEINRRLVAHGVEVTVACAPYPGSVEYVRDGVRYLHLGLWFGHGDRHPFVSYLSYFGALLTKLPGLVRHVDPDLVVEDFAAPFGTVGVPWLTRRPTIGMVQWFFTRDKAREYHLPFHLVERLCLRSHSTVIAVSDDLADALRSRAPGLTVVTVANGLEPEAFAPPAAGRPRHDIAYLGRLENGQKGVDLLLEAYALVAGEVSCNLLIAGDGADEAGLRAQATRLGIADRITWLGRMPREQRLAFLESAQLVAMPSRYETFGLVAAEALARSTPVVAFDVPSLRALVGDDVGRAVPAHDVAAFGAALRELAGSPDLCAWLGSRGPAKVAHLTWDEAARQQLAAYARAGGVPPPRHSGPRQVVEPPPTREAQPVGSPV
jgi:glycosyltransferase involved in cell wall biosynthesis/O-antigen/teichoic acid export membrane protein